MIAVFREWWQERQSAATHRSVYRPTQAAGKRDKSRTSERRRVCITAQTNMIQAHLPQVMSARTTPKMTRRTVKDLRDEVLTPSPRPVLDSPSTGRGYRQALSLAFA